MQMIQIRQHGQSDSTHYPKCDDDDRDDNVEPMM